MKAICWFENHVSKASFSCHHPAFSPDHRSNNLIHVSYLFGCVAKPPTPLENLCVCMTRFSTWNQFSYSCFMIFGMLFGFSGFVFCFFRCQHTLSISTSISTANKKSRKETYFYFYSYLLQSGYNNHLPSCDLEEYEEPRKDISRLIWSSVLCKLQE